MVEALLVLLVGPFVGGGFIYLLVLVADALIGAPANFIGD